MPPRAAAAAAAAAGGGAAASVAGGGESKTQAAGKAQGHAHAQAKEALRPVKLRFKNATMSQASGPRWKKVLSRKALLVAEHYELLPSGATIVNNYQTSRAPPSGLPARRYSDVSGLPAPYTDRRTGMRLANTAEYELLHELPEHAVQQLLALRKAAPSL